MIKFCYVCINLLSTEKISCLAYNCMICLACFICIFLICFLIRIVGLCNLKGKVCFSKVPNCIWFARRTPETGRMSLNYIPHTQEYISLFVHEDFRCDMNLFLWLSHGCRRSFCSCLWTKINCSFIAKYELLWKLPNSTTHGTDQSGSFRKRWSTSRILNYYWDSN